MESVVLVCESEEAEDTVTCWWCGLMRRCRSFLLCGRASSFATCNEDDCGLLSVTVLWTFGRQRAQTVDSDHSSSELFVKVSVHNTSNPTWRTRSYMTSVSCVCPQVRQTCTWSSVECVWHRVTFTFDSLPQWNESAVGAADADGFIFITSITKRKADQTSEKFEILLQIKFIQ